MSSPVPTGKERKAFFVWWSVRAVSPECPAWARKGDLQRSGLAAWVLPLLVFDERPGQRWLHWGWPGLPSSPLGNGCAHEAGPTWRGRGESLGVGAWRSWGCWVGEGSSAHPTGTISQPQTPGTGESQQTIPSGQKPRKAVISQLTSMLMKIISMSWWLKGTAAGLHKMLWGSGERRMEKGKTPPSRRAPETQRGGDRDGNGQMET